uniref:26S proteasome non-ATPase regulatory subunit 1 n=1 Tax=Lygus hesperus TaxID=30085 RepID=A0A146LWI8_LYGHE
MMAYNARENALPLMETMYADDDANIRVGGVWACALAFMGTSNNAALSRLMMMAVNDADDNVKRAAVTSIGFVLANEPQRVVTLLSLLAHSYSPHIRHSVCLAIGIACFSCGFQYPEAVELMLEMLNDKVDIVRQAAFVACGMILNSQNDPNIVAQEEARSAARATAATTTTSSNTSKDGIKNTATLSQSSLAA